MTGIGQSVRNRSLIGLDIGPAAVARRGVRVSAFSGLFFVSLIIRGGLNLLRIGLHGALRRKFLTKEDQCKVIALNLLLWLLRSLVIKDNSSPTFLLLSGSSSNGRCVAYRPLPSPTTPGSPLHNHLPCFHTSAFVT